MLGLADGDGDAFDLKEFKNLLHMSSEAHVQELVLLHFLPLPLDNPAEP